MRVALLQRILSRFPPFSFMSPSTGQKRMMGVNPAGVSCVCVLWVFLVFFCVASVLLRPCTIVCFSHLKEDSSGFSAAGPGAFPGLLSPLDLLPFACSRFICFSSAPVSSPIGWTRSVDRLESKDHSHPSSIVERLSRIDQPPPSSRGSGLPF